MTLKIIGNRSFNIADNLQIRLVSSAHVSFIHELAKAVYSYFTRVVLKMNCTETMNLYISYSTHIYNAYNYICV
jgi:hypothetical protein